MSVMGFQKNWIAGGWVGGWGELYPVFSGIFKTLQSPLNYSNLASASNITC